MSGNGIGLPFNFTPICKWNFSHLFKDLDKNKSLEDIIEEIEEKYSCFPPPKWLLVMLFFLFVLGILFNGFVLLTFIQLPRVRTSTNSFVVSLTVADTLMVIFIPVLYLLLFYDKIEYEIGDELRFFSGIFCSMVSLTSFVCISVDRMLAITKPFYHRTLPRSRCIKAIIFVWIFCIITTLLDFSVSQMESVDEFIVTCFNFSIAFVIPTLITIICYVVIARIVLYKRNGVLQEANHSGNNRMMQNIRITWKILLVILPGVVMWSVYWVPVFIHNGEVEFSYSFEQMRVLIPIFAAVVNPVIFILLTPEFRSGHLKSNCCRGQTDLGRTTQSRER
ncbi:rhodopsin-like [Dendronephthya gigantea]|uniref:rhodopsin-like n=1 Tax=Dendronephthya gigantea TaxID=151771 RepID=UPI001069E8E5|nr:rhodopsin-like [Dendronephthya gigantea]